jgi:mannose-1-phosphate guanylyltransferase
VLGSAGGPRKALPLLDADVFFLVNGDTIAEVDLTTMAEAHMRSGALVTMALVPNRDYLRYGGVHVDDQERVKGFSGRGPASKDTWHFVGVQIVSRSVFASLGDDSPANTVGQVYDELIGSHAGSVNAFCCDVPFWDIGTPADYVRMSVALSSGGLDVGARATIDPSARLTESILWDDVQIGAGASLTRCIVTDRVRVPAGADYTSAILMPDDGALRVTSFEA